MTILLSNSFKYYSPLMRLSILLFLIYPACCIFYPEKFEGSMKLLCDQWNGKFVESKDGKNEGDMCEAVFNIPSNDKEDAMTLCKSIGPYHVEKAQPLKQKTKCQFYAHRMCDSASWKLINNRCYYFDSRIMNYLSASNLCKRMNAQIATLKWSRLTVFIRKFFRKATKIWVESDGSSDHYVKSGSGKRRILACGAVALMYGSSGTSVIRADDEETAYVMCERIPQPTIASLKHTVKMINQFYYHTDIINKSLFFRSSNFYGTKLNVKEIDDQRCNSILKVLSPDYENIEAISPFHLKSFNKKLDDTLIFSHFKAISKHHKNRQDFLCIGSEEDQEYHYYSMHFRAYLELPQYTLRLKSKYCNMEYGTIVRRNLVTAATIAARAPMWCGNVIITTVRIRIKCDRGYKIFERNGKSAQCFRAYFNYLDYDQSQADCETHGGNLAGFETDEEFSFIAGLVNPSKAGTYWLGAQRRVPCRWEGKRYERGFSNDGSSECGRRFVFQWLNGVANNANPIIERYYQAAVFPTGPEPNYLQNEENCLELKSFAKVNDLACRFKKGRICQKNPIFVNEYSDN